MRTLKLLSSLLCIWLMSTSALAQKVGDTVVVVHESQIHIDGNRVQNVRRGSPLEVLGLKDDWLQVSNEPTGWIKKQDVIVPKQAINAFTDQIKHDPRDWGAYVARGAIRFTEGELDAAIADFNEAIRLNPKDSEAFVSRGFCQLRKGDCDKAIVDLTEAIGLEPRNAEAYSNRGLAWNEKKEYGKARADFLAAIRFDSQSDMAYNEVGWLYATCSNARLRDGREAVENAKKACELTAWKRPEYLDTLAAAYAEAGNFDEAVKGELKAIELVSEKEKADYRSRLDLYKSHKPFRDESKK
jgi:tetratricopeptide (TPR) repeat protein